MIGNEKGTGGTHWRDIPHYRHHARAWDDYTEEASLSVPRVAQVRMRGASLYCCLPVGNRQRPVFIANLDFSIALARKDRSQA